MPFFAGGLMPMPEKISIQLGEVQKTLLLPLFGRAMEYEKERPLIRDKYAHDIVEKLDYDFKTALNRSPMQFGINSSIRACHLDAALLQFIGAYPDATIVNIGAGLDTTFQRVDNGRIFWYDLDLPDTIELRRKLIPEGERNVCIAKSVFDRSWFNDIRERRSKVFFMAGGVLVYLKEEEIRRLFLDLIQEFPASEMVFEIYSKIFLWIRNHILVKRNKSEMFAPWLWGVNSAKAITGWSDNIQIVDEYPFYSRINLTDHHDEKSLSLFNVLNSGMWIKMVQLQFG
jgi:O-methyltransferase involved in polyketide biosynthesis